MTASILAIVSALLVVLPAVLNIVEQRKAVRRAAQVAIRRRDVDELERGMAAVDRVSTDGSVSPGGAPVL